MFTTREAAQTQPDTWVVEDIQIRKVVHLHQLPGHLKAPTTTTTTTKTPLNARPKIETDSEMDAFEKELRALQAVREQERGLRDMKTRDKLKGREWEMEGGRGYPTILAIEKEIMAREMLEWEKKVALRRAVEEELYHVRKERVLREQAERERELTREKEARVEKERERVRREMEEKLQKEQEKEVLNKVRELELEEAAVARAVEESIFTEAARKLVDEMREKERMQEIAEKMRMEAEAKAYEERLRRRVEGKRGGYESNTDGFDEPTAPFGPLLPPLVSEVRAFVEEDWQRPPYSPKPDAYPPTYPGGQKDIPYPPHETARYGYAPPPTTGPPRIEGNGRGLRWGVRDLGVDQTDTLGWCKRGKDGRRWCEKTTERWETVIRREGEGRDGYRRYKKSRSSPNAFREVGGV
ncbi:hypothetical protein N657DRAFT_649807 [Parathielavia appendiculata]|uniref:Uncharacterized protein n=1 Tax=Parathielavia appendiculata TaxID=2587402 RepID=A0AAN6TSD4_9PEZI|nr:hypothetical protein N657DRAFT_649807 [Parathielavia appendiculata]